jgi:hypothetical protein
MLERSRICAALPHGFARAFLARAMAAAGCASEPVDPAAAPVPAPAAAKAAARPAGDPVALEQQARALLAQAETDVQRARARRALWTKAWEALVGARAALAEGKSAEVIRLAGTASELAQLGLEQLAYPAVKYESGLPAGRATN